MLGAKVRHSGPGAGISPSPTQEALSYHHDHEGADR